MRTGIYILADDGVYEWTKTLLFSLRATTPDTELVLIPFSNRISRLSYLRRQLQFEIFEDASLKALDDLGREHIRCDRVHPRLDLAGLFRKLASFWGPLDRFMFMDADVVALDGFHDFFQKSLIVETTLQYAHRGVAITYKPGAFRDRMIREYGSQEFNSGLWMSTKGAISLAEVERVAKSALDVVNELYNLDQPFINYCLDLNRTAMRPFSVFGFECAWSGDERPLTWKVIRPGVVRATWPNGDIAPAIHWAGYRLAKPMPYYQLHRRIRTDQMRWSERLLLPGRELTTALLDSLLGRFVVGSIQPITRKAFPKSVRSVLRKLVMPEK